MGRCSRGMIHAAPNNPYKADCWRPAPDLFYEDDPTTTTSGCFLTDKSSLAPIKRTVPQEEHRPAWTIVSSSLLVVFSRSSKLRPSPRRRGFFNKPDPNQVFAAPSTLPKKWSFGTRLSAPQLALQSGLIKRCPECKSYQCHPEEKSRTALECLEHIRRSAASGFGLRSI